MSEKKYYTLEELIEKCKEVDKENITLKNLKSDIEAGERKIENMKLKIKNANLYLQEIDKHTKSIFEFWKFSNKDKIDELPEGEKTEGKNSKLKKTFDYSLDFETFSKELDKRQRSMLTKDEINSIYMTSTDILADINKLLNGEPIKDERIQKLKQELQKGKKLLDSEKFDIFGNSVGDKTKINVLSNKKHRETKKDKIKLLDITKNATLNDYLEYLNKINNNIQSSLKKINMQIELPVYKIVPEDEELDEHLNIFSINAPDVGEPAHRSPIYTHSKGETTLYKINLKEDTPTIGLTNIIFYDNNNQTLPTRHGRKAEHIARHDLIKFRIKR